MKYNVLYSGSTGNCTFIQANEHVYLIDAGVSAKKIIQALELHDISIEMVKGIFLTHEHTDHVIALKQLVDKRNIPVYATKKTFEAINPKYKPQSNQLLIPIKDDEIDFETDGLHVESYRISHDVRQGSFFIFYRNEKKFVYVTDTGYVNENFYEKMTNADGYVIESNHEPELVLNSRYPWHIQQRILSDKGHLSNKDCSLLLKELIGERTKHITLAHLSLENNMTDIAYQTNHAVLDRLGREDIKLEVALPENFNSKVVVL